MPTFGSHLFGSSPFGGINGIVPSSRGNPTAGSYLPPNYFCTQYFSPAYWAGVGLPPTFLAAIRQYIYTNADLVSRITGGLWHRQSPPGVPEPVGIYVIPSSHDDRVGGDHYIQTGQFQVTIFARDSQASRQIADQAASHLSRLKSLWWTNGWLMYFSRANPASPQPPTQGYGGAFTQSESRVFDYQFHGVYSS